MTTMSLKVQALGCRRAQRPIFSALSFAVQPGEFLWIQGENGVGKSSLLRLLAGIATPDTGEILWQDQPIDDPRSIYREQLHYLAHGNGLKTELTVWENWQLMEQLAATTPAFAYTDMLAQLQLTQRQHTLVKHLSAGQKRRVALAKLWLFPKPLWLLDEPGTALDVQTQALFRSQLSNHLQNGGLAIISSHEEIVCHQGLTNKLVMKPC